MLKLSECKLIFVAVGLIGVLLIASPSLGLFVHLPGGERFSELWILGPGMMAENYPFNVRSNESYLIYVGVGNHIGVSSYYVVEVKFRNQTDSMPNATDGTPSSLPSLYEYHAFVQDGENWTAPLAFSFSGVSSSENVSTVEGVTINGAVSDVGKDASVDVENSGYYYQLLIELWIYNVSSDAVQYHNRFVHLWLNMTSNT